MEQGFSDERITLSANGEDIDFDVIAAIAYKGDFYVILQPVELLEDMEEDEALVFKVVVDEDGTDSYIIETDDEIIDAVFEEYNRLLEKGTDSE